ncbi:XRE family transcriptional regulator [Micromonospora chalcea]|uniref:XRE family transcriptional regulator n=1 Tax=Micromonospora chalcea TaxID=1874 RepID=UPI0021A54CD5|nr:XRE family transcriptional regulator [Micromonospora chalcea]MCT2277870.1 XRE family transcriptional regulator [Micromonospora chalcea]
MHTLPAFGVQVRRLAELRGIDVSSLAHRTAVPETTITAVLDGSEPDPSLLCGLALVLGLHAGDLFVIADQPVPHHLAPLDPAAAADIASLSWSLTYLPRAVPELHQLVRSLPQQPRPARPPVPRHQQYPSTPGGLIVRLLHNRNLNWLGSAKYLFGIGRRDMLSASTIGMIGRGTKSLTPDLLAGFAAFLDIPADDLSALTGVDLADDRPPAHPDAAQVAQMLWDARRLTAGQLRQVCDRAHAIRHERADELSAERRCACPGSPREQVSGGG